MPERVFKTARFAKLARKARISDRELHAAAMELSGGQGDDLRGNVWKKRLDRNRSRSIVVVLIETMIVYVALYHKKDRANITDAELADFRMLAAAYGGMDAAMLDRFVAEGRFREISDEKIQG